MEGIHKGILIDGRQFLADDTVLFPGGYATVSGTAVTFHYYTQDYLGNNRAVINGSTGAIEQTVAYYPYGGVSPDISTNPTIVQPYKFGIPTPAPLFFCAPSARSSLEKVLSLTILPNSTQSRNLSGQAHP